MRRSLQPVVEVFHGQLLSGQERQEVLENLQRFIAHVSPFVPDSDERFRNFRVQQEEQSDATCKQSRPGHLRGMWSRCLHREIAGQPDQACGATAPAPAVLHQAFVDALHSSFLIAAMTLLDATVLVAGLLGQKQPANRMSLEPVGLREVTEALATQAVVCDL
jgi:hypothetical protein